jgi:hypothetical protein
MFDALGQKGDQVLEVLEKVSGEVSLTIQCVDTVHEVIGQTATLQSQELQTMSTQCRNSRPEYPKYPCFHLCEVEIHLLAQHTYVVHPPPSAGDTWSGVDLEHLLRPKPAGDLPFIVACRNLSTGGEKLWCVGFLID